jgi:hypothetical protein
VRAIGESIQGLNAPKIIPIRLKAAGYRPAVSRNSRRIDLHPKLICILRDVSRNVEYLSESEASKLQNSQ